MKKQIFILLIATLILTLVNTCLLTYLAIGGQVDFFKPRPVVISKDYDKGQSMEKALATGKPMIVWFYTDWCRFCQKFAPTFKKLTSKKEIKEKYAVAYVNAEAPENRALAIQYEIKGYPSVFLVNGIKKTLINPNELFEPDAVKNLKVKFLDFLK